MKQKLVLIGNGMAGMRTLEELLKLTPDLYDITVFGAEPYGNYNRILLSPVTGVLSALVIGGLAFEGAGLFAHARDLKAGGGEAAASHHRQTTLFGYTYGLRNVLMAANAGFALYLGTAGPDGGTGLVLWGLLSVSVIASALIGRALFYVLVIPTTMPGAFFWKNTAFEEHARKTGLADLPQVGVVPENRL